MQPGSESVSDASTSPAVDCWYLSGPTASGKSRIGIELARQLDAEIISLDSMAVYRGMDIGTAKPSLEDRTRVPHHLIDQVDPGEDFSLSRYVESAHAAILQIRARGREVLFVGGTPLYLKALLRGVYRGPPADWTFRQEIEEELRRVGIESLHERLRLVDPLAAAKLHPHDKRRIIRALEVNKLTGQPLSHRQTHFDEGRPADACRVFVLEWPRDVLHRRIAARVEGMFAGGLVAEVQGLLARFGRLGRTASQAVGYREVLEHLQGACDIPAAIERVTIRTRQFARRQETWFRSLSECRRLPQREDLAPAEVASQILEMDRSTSARGAAEEG